MSNRNFFKDGYYTGRLWKDDYRPGGPYRCTDRLLYPDTCIRDKANSIEWFKGFDKGLSRRPSSLTNKALA